MNRKTEITGAAKSRINRVIYRALTNLLKDRVGGLDYQGYCWIPEDDLNEVYEMFSDAPRIENFSEQDQELCRRLDEAPMVGITHLRLFATLRDQKNRNVEISGMMGLAAIGDETVAYVIGGTTEEDPLTIKFAFPRPRNTNKWAVDVTDDLSLLFKVPAQYGNVFMRLGTKGEEFQETKVSRYHAEENIRVAIDGPKIEPKQPVTRELTCDGCGKKAEPDLDVTEAFRANGMLKNNDPIPSLNLVIINDQLLQLCAECSKVGER